MLQKEKKLYSPKYSPEATLAARKSHLLVRNYERITLCGQSFKGKSFKGKSLKGKTSEGKSFKGEYIPSGGPTSKTLDPWVFFCLGTDLNKGYFHLYTPLAFPHNIPTLHMCIVNILIWFL